MWYWKWNVKSLDFIPKCYKNDSPLGSSSSSVVELSVDAFGSFDSPLEPFAMDLAERKIFISCWSYKIYFLYNTGFFFTHLKPQKGQKLKFKLNYIKSEHKAVAKSFDYLFSSYIIKITDIIKEIQKCILYLTKTK